MDSKTVFVFVEPIYKTSVWYSKSIAGLKNHTAKHHLSLHLLENIDELDDHRQVKIVILISAKLDWTHYMIKALDRRGIKIVSVGAVPNSFKENVSGPILNRQAVIEGMVRYFYNAGRKRMAFIGNEYKDVNDDKKKSYFLQANRALRLNTTENDVYYNKNNISECASIFLDNLDKYDGAICVNDYVGVQLLTEAKKRGIDVPKRLFVAGSGDLIISSCISPTLTTTTLNYYAMGEQAINIWSMLDCNPVLNAVNVYINCNIISRESTGIKPVPEKIVFEPKLIERLESLPIEPTVLKLRLLENCLRECDAVDYGIISGILKGESYEKIASQLFVTQGTVQYRLNKLYNVAGVHSRKTFEDFLRPYVANFDHLIDHVNHI